MKWRIVQAHPGADGTGLLPISSSVPSLTAAFVMAVAAMTMACGSTEPKRSDDPCSPNYVSTGGTVIGPAGGEVVLGSLGVIRLAVPAGAWAQCWEVQLEADYSGYNTPYYPTGFLPSQYSNWGSVSISILRQAASGERIYAPDSMYLELSFPLVSIPADSLRIVGTYYYDNAAMDWRVRLPDARDADFVTVRVSDWNHLWWFGRIDLQRVDFQRYMEPALQNQVGTETWTRIMAVMDSIYNKVSPNLALNCVAANLVQSLFKGLSDNGAAGVRGIQAGLNCGTCDALSSVFWDQWTDYLMAKWSAQFGVDLFLQFVPGAAVLKALAGESISFLIDKAISESFSCHYQCYFDAIPKVWFLYMAEYYVGKGAASLVQDFKVGYLHCPAVTTGGLRFGALPTAADLPGAPAASLCTGSR